MFQWLRSLEGDRLVYGENFFVEPFDPGARRDASWISSLPGRQ